MTRTPPAFDAHAERSRLSAMATSELRQPKVGIQLRMLLDNATDLHAVANPRDIFAVAIPELRTTEIETPMHRHPSPTALSMLAIGTLALGVAVLPAHAATITVCPDGSCNFTDPVAAINTAVTGDIVEIAAGTYFLSGPLSLVGKNLVIRGEVDGNGRPATVLDGQNATYLLNLVLLNESTVIENLVLTNGRAENMGAAYLFSCANPSFRNCSIRGNRAVFRGAMHFHVSNVTMVGCEIIDNAGEYPGQSVGGGIYLSQGTLTLVDCLISGNTATLTGGGIFTASQGVVNLDATRVCGNTAPNGPQIGMNPGAVVTDVGASCVMNNCGDCPTSPPCDADLNEDGTVDGFDLSQVLAQWGPCSGTCTADTDSNGTVDGLDLAVVLAGWGSCR